MKQVQILDKGLDLQEEPVRKSHGATRVMRRKTKQGDRGGRDGNKSGAGLQERSIKEEVVTVTEGTGGELRTPCFVSKSAGKALFLVNLSVLP